jgi:L-fucose isomerase-like protein
MNTLLDVRRYLAAQPEAFLQVPKARLQPIQAKAGHSTVDIEKLTTLLAPIAVLEPLIAVESAEHWSSAVRALGPEIDAILPISIPAYPTEVWNSHPQPLVDRGLPLIFWPLMAWDEPDFWRWSARDFLRALGVEVHIAANQHHGQTLVRSLAVRRFLRSAKVLVFGKQNFPWNATAAGHLVTKSLGTSIAVRTLQDIRDRYERFSAADVERAWLQRAERYIADSVRPAELLQAMRSYLAIHSILRDEQAMAFGVNCFGDLVIDGGRDVPCLAQLLLREDGYVTACDGDYCAILSMMLITALLDKPCMMSNMYPLRYTGALTDHFGDPLAADRSRHPEHTWKNLARLAHCGFVGVISPEMTPSGRTRLTDWGGTYEIKRDGRGCGVDAELAAGMPVTAVELCFDGRTLLLASGKVHETTRHDGMPHCESSVLLEFRDLPGFVEHISREHVAIVYGDHIEQLRTLAGVLGLTCQVF